MTIINPKSIAGVTSITTPSGSDNLFTVHTNNTTERVRINNDGDVIVGSGITVSPDGDIFATGVTTATTFVGALTGNVTGTLQTAAQTNITSVGTLTGLTVGGDISVTGDIKNGTSLIDITQNDRIEVDIAGTEIVDINGNGVDVVGGVDITGTLKLTDAIEHSGDSNTKIRFPAADTVSVETAGSERLRIYANGAVLIGADSGEAGGDAKLAIDCEGMDIYDGVGDAANYGLIFANDPTSNKANGIGFFNDSATTCGGYIVHQDKGSGNIGDLVFATSASSDTPVERLRITSDGTINIGAASPTASENGQLNVYTTTSSGKVQFVHSAGTGGLRLAGTGSGSGSNLIFSNNYNSGTFDDYWCINHNGGDDSLRFLSGGTGGTERARFTSAGKLLVGTTDTTPYNNSGSSGEGVVISNDNIQAARSGDIPFFLNRLNDSGGTLAAFYRNGSQQGTISVSGSTVSYNGGHLSRWSQIKGLSTTDKTARPTIYQGTVMSNLDDLCVWDGEDNQQLNMTKISDIEGDKDVAGVFYTWDDDDDTVVNDFYIAMTGDMVIRVAASTTVARGDLLISAGDGTAKPQSDDIVRSSTIAKITSINHTATYDDGSKAYPCVLMAC